MKNPFARALAAMFIAGLASPLSAQDFNIKCGVASVPSSSYGAASGQTGTWNLLQQPATPILTPLLDTAGQATGAWGHAIDGCDAGGCPCANCPGSADDLALLQTVMFGDCFAEPVEIELGGFEPGRYRLHTYGYGPCGSAWAISVNLSVRNAANQNVYATEFAIQGPQFTGTWIGFPVAVSTLDLSPGYTIVAFVMAGSKCGLAGFQLEFQEPTGSISCLGDGTGAACPCSNFGLPGHGCRNSNSIRGAELGAVGSANLAADTLGLSCTFVLPNVTSVFLQGDQQIVPVPFGDGLRCAGGSLKRLFILNASGTGTVAAPVNGQPSVSERSAELGDPIPAGGTRFYQVYYRDPDPSFCPTPQGSTFNVSNAVELLWAP